MRHLLTGKKHTGSGLSSYNGSSYDDFEAKKSLVEALHKGKDNIAAIYDDLANQYNNYIELKIKTNLIGLPSSDAEQISRGNGGHTDLYIYNSLS